MNPFAAMSQSVTIPRWGGDRSVYKMDFEPAFFVLRDLSAGEREEANACLMAKLAEYLLPGAQRYRLHVARTLSSGNKRKALQLLSLPLLDVAVSGVEAVWPDKPR